MAFSMCNRAVILSTSSAEVLDEDEEKEDVSALEGAGAFKYRRRKGGKTNGCRCGGMRRGFGVTIETGSRHVGQQVIGEDGPAVILIASDMQVWQYTCPQGRATGDLRVSRQMAQVDIERI
jgi:hypothetical protein